MRCERNVLRYRPLRRVALVVGDHADHDDAARLAARTAGVHVVDDPNAPGVDRVRALGRTSDDQLRAWRSAGLDVDVNPAVADARVELRRWVREQAVSTTNHRYGRLLP